MKTINEHSIETTPSTTHSKLANIGLWILQIALALMFIMAGTTKIIGEPEMVALFDSIGFGQWFRYTTGILEVAGAVLLLVPFLASIGALLLTSIMVGALLTHLFLGGSAVMAMVLLALASTVVWGRWDRTLQFVFSKRNR